MLQADSCGSLRWGVSSLLSSRPDLGPIQTGFEAHPHWLWGPSIPDLGPIQTGCGPIQTGFGAHPDRLWGSSKPALGTIQTSSGDHRGRIWDPSIPAVGPIQTGCGAHPDRLWGPSRPALRPIQAGSGAHSDRLWGHPERFWGPSRPDLGPIHTGCGAHPVSCSMSQWSCFRGVKLLVYSPYLVPRFRMNGAMPQLPPAVCLYGTYRSTLGRDSCRYSDSLRPGRSGDQIPVESIQTSPGTYPASYTMCTGSLRGVKRPGRGVNYPPHLVSLLKKEYSYTSTTSWPVLRVKLTLTLTFTSLPYWLQLRAINHEVFSFLWLSDHYGAKHSYCQFLQTARSPRSVLAFVVTNTYEGARQYPVFSASLSLVTCHDIRIFTFGPRITPQAGVRPAWVCRAVDPSLRNVPPIWWNQSTSIPTQRSAAVCQVHPKTCVISVRHFPFHAGGEILLPEFFNSPSNSPLTSCIFVL